MPKLIELTLELCIHKVSCPGVWLCQDGRVSLTVTALGTNYQTCLLPPVFPIMFKDIFYFRKRFQESCTLNNLCCLLDDETIYCELIQWSEDCSSGEFVVLAQYLGAMNDVLFPPKLCANDGVDLLMRRSKQFPGILAPKIEISTKVRIDEVWNQPVPKAKMSCACVPEDREARQQKQVCHSPMFHRIKCAQTKRPPSCGRPRSRSRSRSSGSRSCISFGPVEMGNCSPSVPKGRESRMSRRCESAPRQSRRCESRPCSPRRVLPGCPQYHVYNVDVSQNNWPKNNNENKNKDSSSDIDKRSIPDMEKRPTDVPEKTTVESRFIEDDSDKQPQRKAIYRPHITPCVCQICKKYHELFHSGRS